MVSINLWNISNQKLTRRKPSSWFFPNSKLRQLSSEWDLLFLAHSNRESMRNVKWFRFRWQTIQQRLLEEQPSCSNRACLQRTSNQPQLVLSTLCEGRKNNLWFQRFVCQQNLRWKIWNKVKLTKFLTKIDENVLPKRVPITRSFSIGLRS